MYKKLTPKEIVYNFDLNCLKVEDSENELDYKNVFYDIKKAISIDDYGYNLYIMDNSPSDNIDKVQNYINELYKERKAPRDICYMSFNTNKHPRSLFLSAGNGKKLEDAVKDIKKFYFKLIFDFFNDSTVDEKEDLMDMIDKKRSEAIDELILLAKDKGFFMKIINDGFAFIPVNSEDEEMTEDEYNSLSSDDKENILNEISFLKQKSKVTINKIKNFEDDKLKIAKEILKKYIKESTESLKHEYEEIFESDFNVLEILTNICLNIEKKIIDEFTFDYLEDDDIDKMLSDFDIKLIVDNSNNKNPICMFEKEPTVENLIGKIEYDSSIDGSYKANLNNIKVGSMLKCNDGCIVINADTLIQNSLDYYYLRKALIYGKVDFNYNKGYLDLFSLGSSNFESINLNLKVILIGSYETYNLLYTYDNEFKNIFKLKSQYYPQSNINNKSISLVMSRLKNICKKQGCLNLKEDAIKEIFKYLSKKAECKNKIYLNESELKNLIVLSNAKAREENRDYIDKLDIVESLYNNDVLEKSVLKNFKEKKDFIDLNEYKVGQVNGLSVIDGNYFKFGKPERITCCCCFGSGNIYDAQNESNLDGNIHKKSIQILKGLINNILGGYDALPVDFYLSFEQVYGKLDGDSASVAEAVAIISSLTKIPINQNVAVTGSIDQFGKVQPIGGVNEKIEGYFNVCKEVDSVKNKYVLIPSANVDNLILKNEVEKAVCENKFFICSMDNIFDACYLLLNKKKTDIIESAQKEMKKYLKNKKKM